MPQMTYRHVQVMLPGIHQASSAWLDITCPYLQKLLAVANAYPNPFNDSWDKLTAIFKLSSNLPAAACLALQQGKYCPDKAYLLAEPVECKPDLKTVFCLGNQHLAILANEATQLATDATNLLPDDAKLSIITPNTWLLETANTVDIATLPLSKATQQSLQTEWMTGKNRQAWQRLQTEIQMLWHESAVNSQRAAALHPPINSLWLSGEGELPKAKQSIWQYVWTDDFVTQGLAIHMQCQLESIAAFNLPLQQDDWHGLVVLNDLSNLCHQQAAWQQQLQDYDKLVFKPLWEALRRNQLNAVSLWLGAQSDYQITRRNCLRFWRSKKNLAHYMQTGISEYDSTENY